MAGGYGQKLLSKFYAADFVPVTPPDWEMKPLHRIVSVSEQSVVDEMIITFTHSQPIPWLLPGIPATNKKISIALIAIVRFKDGKIHHEHIYWDQGTVLKQAGLIGDTVKIDGVEYPAPVKGAEAAKTVEEDSSRVAAQVGAELTSPGPAKRRGGITPLGDQPVTSILHSHPLMSSAFAPYCPAKIGERASEADTPALLIDVDALQRNIRSMQSMVKSLHALHKVPHPIAIRPHYKTVKCLDIAIRQVFDRGAAYPLNPASHSSTERIVFTSGVCCAKLAECESLIHGRCSDGTRAWLAAETGGAILDERDIVWDILLTNEVIGVKKAARMTELLKLMEEKARLRGVGHHRFKVCVDCPEQVDELVAVAKGAGVHLPLYIELQNGGLRCGVDSPSDLVSLARYIRDHPSGAISFAGIHAYQGRNQHIRNFADRVKAVMEGPATGMVREAVELLKRERIVGENEVVQVSGSGTGTFPLEIASHAFTEIQPGSYAVMDADYLANANPPNQPNSSRFETSLTVLSTITSVHVLPSPRVLCDTGLKAVSVETFMPSVLSIWGNNGGIVWQEGTQGGVAWKFTSGGDEHGVLIPKAAAVGDEARMREWVGGVQGLVGGKVVLRAGHCDPTINLMNHAEANGNGAHAAVAVTTDATPRRKTEPRKSYQFRALVIISSLLGNIIQRLITNSAGVQEYLYCSNVGATSNSTGLPISDKNQLTFLGLNNYTGPTIKAARYKDGQAVRHANYFGQSISASFLTGGSGGAARGAALTLIGTQTCERWLGTSYPDSWTTPNTPYDPVLTTGFANELARDTTYRPQPNTGWLASVLSPTSIYAQLIQYQFLPWYITYVPSSLRSTVGSKAASTFNVNLASQGTGLSLRVDGNTSTTGTLPPPFGPANAALDTGMLSRTTNRFFVNNVSLTQGFITAALTGGQQSALAYIAGGGQVSLNLLTAPYFQDLSTAVELNATAFYSGDSLAVEKALDDAIGSILANAVIELARVDKSVLLQQNASQAAALTYLSKIASASKSIPAGGIAFRALDFTNGKFEVLLQAGTDKRIAASSNIAPQWLRNLWSVTDLSNMLLRELATAIPAKNLTSPSISQGYRHFPSYSNTDITLPLSSLIGRILYPWGVSFLIPIFVIAIVKEKEDRIAVMMKMVLPSDYGVRKPFWFPITDLVAFINKKKTEKADIDNESIKDKQTAIPIDRVTSVVTIPEEDDDVREERARVIAGRFDADATPLYMHGMRKVYDGRLGKGPKIAVNSITFAVEEGRVFGLLGPNGAGKTTLISILTGIYAPTAGEAVIAGYNIPGMGIPTRRLFHLAVWDDLTVEEHLLFYARLKGVPAQEESAAVLESMKTVALDHFAGRLSKGLSGGEKRRLSIAIALVGNPACVFLDEPTTGLDPEVRRNIWTIIEKARVGKTIILTTHSMEEAEVLCQRIAIMAKGNMRCLGSVLRLKQLYGSGFKLSFSAAEKDMKQATEYVESLLPARAFERIDSFATVGGYEFIPTPGLVGDLFDRLQRESGAHGINDWGLSQTSLEEVFLQIISDEDANAD
ncbi:hypothetical protein HDU93_009524 [Gonapodya sp. JEL0774]|nr:hypothetical protein HDU93_009524 [Gonapodya sp. JEL0774]